MALPFDEPHGGMRDARAVSILAKTIYRELRGSGYAEREIISLAGELLAMVTRDVRDTRGRP